MKKAFLFLASVFISLLSVAQAPGIEWQKSLGGTGADEGKSIIPTSDGGYIVGGTADSNDGDISGSHGGKDCWIVKLNPTGSIEWQKTYGGTGTENFGSIRPTRDGGYIMGASTNSNDGNVSGNHGYSDAWIIKLNSTGEIEWQKCFGSSSGDGLSYVEETLDGGYICLGTASTNDGDLTGQSPELSGSWVFKLSAARTIEWQKAYFDGGGINGGTVFNSIRQTSDSGYVYCGFSRGISGSVFTAKLNSAGTYVNGEELPLQTPGMYESIAPKAITPTSDGGCISVYRNDGPTGQFLAPMVRKYNSAMAVEWTRELETSGTTLFPGYITTTPEGGYLLTGYSYSSTSNIPGRQGGNDFWLAKLNGTGVLQWQRLLGSAGNDIPFWVESAADSSYVVVGNGAANSGDITGNHGGNDIWAVKLPYSSPGYGIISSAGANGTISPNGGIIYPAGINQIFTISPTAGYRIANVLVDGVSNGAAISSGSYKFTDVNASHTISATFATNTFTIIASTGANGSISATGASTFNYGSSYTYNITPAAGYSILDVLVDSSPINPVSSYAFSNITTNHTIRAIFASLDSIEAFVCPAGDSGTITSNLTGTSYRWQLNSGAPTNNGYVNLNDGERLYFTGTSTATLTIKNYQSSAFGYKYRCVVDEASSLVNVLRFKNIWNGTFDTHWEIPQNWSCGILPDENTDVVIPAGTNLIISTNITVRSLNLGVGANVTLAAGGNLNVLH